MLNQKHITGLATKEKINSELTAEINSWNHHKKTRQSFLELSRGKDHLLLCAGKALSNAAQDVTGLFFPANLHYWLMISLFCTSFVFPAKLLSSGHPQAYAAPQARDFAFLLAELQVSITPFL